MKPVLARIFLLILSGLGIAVVVLAGYFLYSSNSIQFFPTKVNPKYLFYGHEDRPYLFGFEWDKDSKLLVSGIVDREIYNKDGKRYIEIKIPSSKNLRSVKVKAYFDKKDNSILVLRLQNGRFGDLQTWREVEIQELAKYLKRGRQTEVRIDASEENAESFAKLAESFGYFEAGPIIGAIVGIFED